jgi:hypothetical protein
LWIEVSSEATPAAADAVNEAAGRFDDALLAELLRYQPDMEQDWIRTRLPSLWSSPVADRKERTVEISRPFGTLYRRTISFRVPLDAVSEWLLEQQRESNRILRCRVLVGIVTASVWIAAACGAVWLDRRTNGYQRPAIALLSAALASAVTIGAKALLFWM